MVGLSADHFSNLNLLLTVQPSRSMALAGLARQFPSAIVNLTGRWNKIRINPGDTSILDFLRDAAHHRNAGEDENECRNDDNCILYLHNTPPV
jgi:hypothetical protein